MGLLESIFGTKFFDTNKNGKIDPGERLTEQMYLAEIQRRKVQKEQQLPFDKKKFR